MQKLKTCTQVYFARLFTPGKFIIKFYDFPGLVCSAPRGEATWLSNLPSLTQNVWPSLKQAVSSEQRLKED